MHHGCHTVSASQSLAVGYELPDGDNIEFVHVAYCGTLWSDLHGTAATGITTSHWTITGPSCSLSGAAGPAAALAPGWRHH